MIEKIRIHRPTPAHAIANPTKVALKYFRLGPMMIPLSSKALFGSRRSRSSSGMAFLSDFSKRPSMAFMMDSTAFIKK